MTSSAGGYGPAANSPDADEAWPTGKHAFVLAASRLPVDQVEAADGSTEWQQSPGGLVTALEPVLRDAGGVWIGWSGAADEQPEPFDAAGMHLVRLGLTSDEIRGYYEGFCNATLWPLYHDVIVPPAFHRSWWDAYVRVNRRYARAAAEQAAPGATVWVHDYQLQLVPGMLRAQRSDVRIGIFTHIPFPGYEIFAQLPWRRQIVEGLLGADLVGFQRHSDAANFLRACRRTAGLATRGSFVRIPASPAAPAAQRPGQAVLDGTGSTDAFARPVVSAPRQPPDLPSAAREVRAAAFPISIDTAAFEAIASQDTVRARAKEIRQALGDPAVLMLGIDRLDYTKGILHRLNAYGELLNEGRLDPADAKLVLVASPSRERVEHYQVLRDEVEVAVGRINGDHAELGHTPVHYLHQTYPREEIAALYLAADVMLVTALRDGMNLIAKEYVACRQDETGALVLSEFTGAADELGSAFLVNPHDIDGLKDAIVRAATIPAAEARRRMRAMRRRVREHDVRRWAATFLNALEQTPEPVRLHV
ncbi:MAG TPA: trehalose-6-phosphate synthase [Streptosporangiaceae bacterium]